MAKRIHIICGMCGGVDFRFEINPLGDFDDDNNPVSTVDVVCENCKTLTELNEVMKHNNKIK